MNNGNNDPSDEIIITRPSQVSDLLAITEIYNEAIETTIATFDTVPKTMDEQKEWYTQHGTMYPIIVAILEDQVVGWASLSRWSDRCAYSDTAELSLYVKHEHRGKGVGRRLMEAIIEAGDDANLHTLLARIADGNEVSVHIHEVAGFRHIGVMREVGSKFGRLLDVYLMQYIYR
jgi:L-amino acid N-acyltransferase